ncbi:DUF7303 family protein [Neisseria wadsworthii]|uniref:DUF7303 family protein n=1 Tax=Neisseria wadsworthii TaxID=607711 RepID=UPI000D31FC20|nr:hypothetical protein [Neisseria wadsworthii]
MSIYKIEDGYPMPKRQSAGKCIYPFDKMKHGQSFFVVSGNNAKKTRDHITGSFRRWKRRAGKQNLGYKSAEVIEDSIEGIRFWLVDRG